MKRSALVLLIGSTAAAALIGACSSGDDSGGLLGRSSYGSSGGPTGSSSGGSSSGSSSGSAMSSSSGSSSGGAASSSSSSGGPTAPPPDAGPGSTSSAAHVYFDSTVYADLAVCQGCHGTAATTTGAPQMMTAPADTAYSSLDALGLIVSNSLLLTKGSHDNGAAPALTTTQTNDITTWLAMEATERAGTAAPTNILAEVAQCASQTEWNAIGWGKLRTVPRATENADKCSGCNNAMCASCHDGGEQGFFMAEGSDIEPAGTTFQQTFGPASVGPQYMTYIIQYFGLNGTTPVASNAIMLKQTAVATGPAYSHPMFTMSSTMQTALNTFVTNTITSYTSGACGDGGVPAGDDAGP